QLQLPAALQARLNASTHLLGGGGLVKVFVMGMVSALIVGPCVTGPLAGALISLSLTKDVFLGGSALYALACGMSVPLLLVGVSAGTLLPRSGPWMEMVKNVFGLLLLGVAWWMLLSVLPTWAAMWSLAAILLLAAGFAGAFEVLADYAGMQRRLLHVLGYLLIILAAVQVVGALAG